MKNMKRIMLTAVAMLLLVVMSVGGTLAWMTSQTEPVVNTFTVGSVEIDLDEAALKAFDETKNEYAEDPDQPRVKSNEYQLMPGIKMAKDPTVTVIKGSEDCYVRAFVTVTYRAAADGFIPANFFTAWVKGFDATVWVPYNAGETVTKFQKNIGTEEKPEMIDMISRTYELRYFEEVAQNKEQNTVLTDIFTSIELPGSLTNAQIASMDDLQISVIANAIQADGSATAADAWAKWN